MLSLLLQLQLEGILYACARHQELLPSGERAGFFIGDGAGVGKGRQIAGCIMDNYVRGRRCEGSHDVQGRRCGGEGQVIHVGQDVCRITLHVCPLSCCEGQEVCRGTYNRVLA